MKYLMVCLGNICRSQMAKGVLLNKLSAINSTSEVDSCGFESYHVGDNPDIRAQRIMKANGIDISKYRARLFSPDDFSYFDKIFVMDKMNYSSLKYYARNDSDIKKVDFLMNVVYPGKNESVPDPYYGLEQGFKFTFDKVSLAADAIINLYEK